MDMKNILFQEGKPVPVLNNFRLDLPALGIGRLFKEDNFMKCEIMMRPDMEESEAIPFLTPPEHWNCRCVINPNIPSK